MSEKTAIILSGGGMRGSHGGGFLYALATQLQIIPDIILASSGDIGNAFYFSTKQYDLLPRIWSELVCDPRFINPWRPWRFMDVDYLVDTILRVGAPLTVESLSRSEVRWIVPVTNARTGATRFITADDHLDPYEIMRAGKAVPFYFGKRVFIEGVPYIDGEVGATLDDLFHRVVSEGATRVLIINHGDNHPHLSSLERAYSWTLPHGLREAFVHDYSSPSVCPVGDAHVHVWCPPIAPIPASFACRDKKLLHDSFERGVADASAMEHDIRTLFSL